MTEHYENVQGTGTDGDVTVQGTGTDGDVTVQGTDVEGGYTTLDRPDQETFYEELKSI